MFQKRIQCGHCAQINDARFYQLTETRITEPAPDAKRTGGTRDIRIEQLRPQDILECAAYGFCALCTYPTLLIIETPREFYDTVRSNAEKQGGIMGSSKMTIIKQYPEPTEINAHESWPEKVSAFYKDAKIAHENQDVSAASAATAAGSCLEQALKHLNASGGRMIDMIDDLANRNEITRPIKDWAHQIRLMRNIATHEAEATREDVEEMISFIEIFLEVTFTIPNHIEAQKKDRGGNLMLR